MSVVTLTPTLVKDAYEPAATAVVDLDREFAITSETASTKTFVVAGDQTASFPAGKKFEVIESAANNGVFTVVSSAFSSATSIVVVETVVDGTDGHILVGAFEPAATGGDTNDFVCTERELVFARNVHASAAKTFTVTSVPNAHNRLGSITAHSVAAGAMAVLPFFRRNGWTSGTKIALSGADANLEFLVLKLPR